MLVDGRIRLKYIRCGREIFESGEKQRPIEKYPDTCGRGLSGPYFKTHTAEGTNQNSPFHQGPVQPYNKSNYHMASSVSGKMNQILRCDWLPERSR